MTAPDDTVATGLLHALCEMGDQALAELRSAIDDELRQRAVDSGDLDALVEEAFRVGFDAKGQAQPPWLHGRVLVCPGAKVSSSAMSHACRFVSVDDTWVWEHPDVITDTMRPRGPHSSASITLLVARDGLECEVVASRARGGTHTRVSVEGYRIAGDTVVSTGKRSSAPRSHR